MKLWREAYLRGEPWALAAWKAWTTAPVILVLVGGCSADYMREHEAPGTKNGVVTDLHKYCISNPKDSACQRDK